MPKQKNDAIALIKSTFFHESETKARLADFILKSSRLSMGEQCASFEAAFSTFQERKFTALFNSGSSANLVLIQSLLNLGRLGPGSKVGFSAVTWPTNVMPILQLGLTPIPVDIQRQTLNVSSKSLLAALNLHPDMRALFVSNILGFCADLDAIAEICIDRGIILLEDNCESLGSQYRGRKLGNFGCASTFSTFVGHHLSTIEGGAVCTDDPDLQRMLVMVRAHGWDRHLTGEERDLMRQRFNVDPFYGLYTFYESAYNCRPTEVTGFLGLQQLELASTIIGIRQRNFDQFHGAALLNPRLHAVEVDHMDVVSNFAYPVVCKDREEFRNFRQRFSEDGVEVRPIVAGNIVTQPFFRKYDDKPWDLPEADFIHHHGFYFPNNPELTVEETLRLVNLLKRGSHDHSN